MCVRMRTHLHAMQLCQKAEDAGNHRVGGREDFAALAALQQLCDEGQHRNEAAALVRIHHHLKEQSTHRKYTNWS